MTATCINYGGLLFTRPVPAAYGLAPRDAGIVAIQVRNDSYTPLPFEPIAFEESACLATFVLDAQPAFRRWRAHGLAAAGLFVSYATLRFESPAFRIEARTALEAQYTAVGRMTAGELRAHP